VDRFDGWDGIVSVDVDIVQITAEAGIDYETFYSGVSCIESSCKTTLIFQDGEAFKLMGVNILNDDQIEGDELFNISLSNPTNDSILADPADVLVLIADDESESIIEPADFYVATNGSDSNPGTIDQPFATVPHAISLVQPGELIYIRGGTYTPAESFFFSGINGLEGQMIRVFAYPGEKPIFDFSLDLDTNQGWGLYESSYWHIKGIAIYNAHDVGMRIRNNSNYNIIEDMEFAFNEENGFAVHTFSTNNLILNNVSHHNYDPDRHGEDADGYVVGTNAIDNTLRGNIAHDNSDDGFDLWESINTTLEGNVAYSNGFDLWGEGANFNGDGNGYKLGQGIGGHLLIGNIGWGNAATGATFNTASGPLILYNNTMYGQTNNYYFKERAHVLRNNISFNGSFSLDEFTDDQNNSWNLGISDPGFLSEDTMSPDFLKLAPGSPAIDAGVDLGLPFSGNAPDLGAHEF
jgi:parallel beta-helix repeat protein